MSYLQSLCLIWIAQVAFLFFAGWIACCLWADWKCSRDNKRMSAIMRRPHDAVLGRRIRL
jgi:hypothetical protein